MPYASPGLRFGGPFLGGKQFYPHLSLSSTFALPYAADSMALFRTITSMALRSFAFSSFRRWMVLSL